MNKELLQQVLDALENSSDLVFKDLSKSYLRELAVNTLREAIAQPEQPAAPVAPIPALPVWWDKFIVNVCEMPDRNSPEDEPDAMIATAKELESCALCAMDCFLDRPVTPPVAQAEPMFWVRLRSDGGYEGPLHNDSIEAVRKNSGAWTALFPHSIKDADSRDAGRYRFLKSEAYEAVIPFGGKIDGSRAAWITKFHPGADFDEAIDAAIQAKDATP